MTSRAEVGRRARPARWRAYAAYDSLALLAALLVLAPVLGPGLLLTYDMVWVPDLAVTSAGWGLVDGVPRAVPSDQVVALLDEVVPGPWLQDLVLLGALVGAGAGYHRVVRDAPVAARCLAAVLAVWNPFVAERLLIGHWPTLLAHAVLPWLVLAGRRAARSGRVPAVVPVLVVLGSLNASAGLMTALAVALFVGYGGARTRRASVALAATVAAANAPWVVAGALAADAARADPGTARLAAEAFAAHGRDGVPTLVAVLGGGGIWNAETAAPYDAVRAWGWALLVGGGVVATAVGGVLRSRGSGDRTAAAALVAAGLGLAVALHSAVAPALGARLATGVPGGGLLRDATRWEALLLPAAVLGCAGLLRRLLGGAGPAPATGRPTPAAVGAGVAAALLPVALLPGLLGAAGGELSAVPSLYPDLGPTLAAETRTGTRPVVLSLPYAAYRAPSWNDGRPVLDPVPRLVGDVEVVASDDLFVSGRRVSGEDPRRDDVLVALSEDDPVDRATALRALGITHVVRALGPDVDAAPDELDPVLPGDLLLAEADLEVVRLPGGEGGGGGGGGAARPADGSPLSARVALTVAWSCFATVLLAPVGAASWRGLRTGRGRSSREHGSAL